MRRVGDRYFDGEADEERRERYERCEAVAHDLLEYCEQRVVQHPAATREDHLPRIAVALPMEGAVLLEEEDWVLRRTAVLLGWEAEWVLVINGDGSRPDAR